MKNRSRIWSAMLAFALLAASALAAQRVAAPPDDLKREADLAELAAAIAADPELTNALSTSHEGLYEEAMPDGGVGVDLQGRFRQLVFARLGPDGKVVVGHSLPLPLILEPSGEAAACRPVEVALPGDDRAIR